MDGDGEQSTLGGNVAEDEALLEVNHGLLNTPMETVLGDGNFGIIQ
jgi:hypothetical protein